MDSMDCINMVTSTKGEPMKECKTEDGEDGIGDIREEDLEHQMMDEESTEEEQENDSLEDEFDEDPVSPLNDLGAAILSGKVNDVFSFLSAENINTICACTESGYCLPPLHLAAREDEFDIAKILLEKGADINTSALLESGRDTGNTALYYAAANSRLKLVKLMLERNFDINQRNLQGNSLLNVAIECNDTDVVEYLLNQGADPTIACSGQFEYEDFDALDNAVLRNKSDVVSMLLDRGCCVNRRTQADITPLVLSLEHHVDIGECKKVIHLLLENGADPNHADLLGCTALHTLLRFQHEIECDYIDILSNYGLNVNVQDVNGQTALHLLARKGLPGTVRKLLKFGAEINIRDLDGNTPAHLAAAYGNLLVLEIFLTSGYKNVLNCFQETVSDILLKNTAKYGDDALLETTLKEALGTEVEELLYSEKSGFHTYNARTLLRLSSSECVLRRIIPRVTGMKWNVYTMDVEHISPEQYVENEVIKKLELSSIKNYILTEICDSNSMGTFHWDCECPGEEEEKCMIVRGVNNLVQELAELLGRKEKRFRITVLPSGSSFEGAKMGGPDECDYLLVLEELSKPGVCELVSSREIEAHTSGDYISETEPGYSLVRVNKNYRYIWKEFVTEEGFLLPAQLRNYLNILLWDASKYLHDRNQNKLIYHLVTSYIDMHIFEKNHIPLVRSTEVGACLYLRWRGTHYHDQLVDVDLVLAIHIPGWPKEARELTGDMKHNMANGFHIVPKNARKETLGWRVSFTLAEGSILRDTSELQMKCYRSLKLLRDIFPTVGMFTLNTYVLKTEFFHYLTTCRAIDWEEKELIFHVRKIFQSILSKLQQKTPEILTSLASYSPTWQDFSDGSSRVTKEDETGDVYQFYSFFIPSCVIAVIPELEYIQNTVQNILSALHEA